MTLQIFFITAIVLKFLCQDQPNLQPSQCAFVQKGRQNFPLLSNFYCRPRQVTNNQPACFSSSSSSSSSCGDRFPCQDQPNLQPSQCAFVQKGRQNFPLLSNFYCRPRQVTNNQPACFSSYSSSSCGDRFPCQDQPNLQPSQCAFV